MEVTTTKEYHRIELPHIFCYNANAMRTEWTHVPEFLQAPLQELVRTFGEMWPKVHHIILFGSFARGTDKYDSDADILIVHRLSQESGLKLQHTVKNWAYNHMPVRTDVVSDHRAIFDRKLEYASPFYMDICRDGILLYTDGREFVEPRQLDPKEQQELAQNRFDTNFGRGEGALLGFEFYLNQQHYDWAAFNLHQAAENAFKAMLLVYDFYVEKSHDLEALIKRCVMRSPVIVPAQYQEILEVEARPVLVAMANAAPMPEEFTQTQQDWIHLCNSYVPPRYEEGYEALPIEQLLRMKEMVNKMMEEIKEVCLGKIEEIGNPL